MIYKQVDTSCIKINQGEDFTSACTRILWDYVNANGERHEMLKDCQVQAALHVFYHWHHSSSMRNIFFGRDLAEKLNKIEAEGKDKVNKCR